MEGSEDNTCDENGQCNCKCNIKGVKCDECNSEYYGFPECHGKRYIKCTVISTCVTSLDNDQLQITLYKKETF